MTRWSSNPSAHREGSWMYQWKSVDSYRKTILWISVWQTSGWRLMTCPWWRRGGQQRPEDRVAQEIMFCTKGTTKQTITSRVGMPVNRYIHTSMYLLHMYIHRLLQGTSCIHTVCQIYTYIWIFFLRVDWCDWLLCVQSEGDCRRRHYIFISAARHHFLDIHFQPCFVPSRTQPPTGRPVKYSCVH